MTYGVPPNVLAGAVSAKPTTDPVTLAAASRAPRRARRRHDGGADRADGWRCLVGRDRDAGGVRPGARGQRDDQAPATRPRSTTSRAVSSGGNSWSGILGPIEHGVDGSRSYANAVACGSKHLGHGGTWPRRGIAPAEQDASAAFGQVVSAGRDLIGVAADFKGVARDVGPHAGFGGVLSFVQVLCAVGALSQPVAATEDLQRRHVGRGRCGHIGVGFRRHLRRTVPPGGSRGDYRSSHHLCELGHDRRCVGSMGERGAKVRTPGLPRGVLRRTSRGLEARDMASSARDAVTGWLHE